jgi:hypothetical protein
MRTYLAGLLAERGPADDLLTRLTGAELDGQRLEGLTLASAEPWVPRKALHVHGPARLAIRFQPGRRRG